MTSWNLTPEQQKLHDLWERHLMCEFATHDSEMQNWRDHFGGPTWQALHGSSVMGDAANANHFPAPGWGWR